MGLQTSEWLCKAAFPEVLRITGLKMLYTARVSFKCSFLLLLSSQQVNHPDPSRPDPVSAVGIADSLAPDEL